MQLEFSIEGEKQVSRRLDIVATGITDFKTPLEKIGGELKKTFELNFAQEGAMFGGWAERKKSYPWPILDNTGKMKGSFAYAANETQVAVFNPTPYFKYHQSNKPRTKMPRRVMMKIDQERRKFIITQFQLYIRSLVKQNFADLTFKEK